MAQINEYTTQVAAPEGIGGVSPNIELAGAEGKGLENLGSAISQGALFVRRRQAQEETADVYANYADTRADFTQRIQQQTQDGSLDVDKLMDDYDQTTGDGYDKLNTSEGQNFFTRQQARLRAELLKQANYGKSQIASNEAQGKLRGAVQKNITALDNNPAQLPDLMAGASDLVDQSVQNGQLPEKMREKYVQDIGQQYIEAAVLSHARIGDNGPEAARQLLKTPDLADHLTLKQRETIGHEINAIEHAKRTDRDLLDKNIERADKAKEKLWYDDNFDKINSGAMTSMQLRDAVKNGDIGGQFATHVQGVLDASLKREKPINHHTYSNLLNRISPTSDNPLSGPNDPAILKAIANQEIPLTGRDSADTIRKAFNASPQGKVYASDEDTIKKMADSIKNKNFLSMSGLGSNTGYDTQSIARSNKFRSDFYNAREQYVKSGGNPHDLLDPDNKNYWPSNKRVEGYKVNWQNAADEFRQDRVDKAMGLRATGTDKDPVPKEEAKKSNETWFENIMRAPPPGLKSK